MHPKIERFWGAYHFNLLLAICFIFGFNPNGRKAGIIEKDGNRRAHLSNNAV